jgi:hypothetical protein
VERRQGHPVRAGLKEELVRRTAVLHAQCSMSAPTDLPLIDDSGGMPGMSILTKPFSVDALKNKINELLKASWEESTN